jgi:hypothetical protein
MIIAVYRIVPVILLPMVIERVNKKRVNSECPGFGFLIVNSNTLVKVKKKIIIIIINKRVGAIFKKIFWPRRPGSPRVN